jgi:hypothetical protein
MAKASFETDIKPLFRDRDVNAMKRWFNLRNYNDVSANADEILGRLDAGDMPCDEAWPPGKVDLFRKWIADGKQP